jgi:hypothetical protein
MNAQETMDNLRNFRVHFVSFQFTLRQVYTFHCHLLVPSSLSPTPAHRGPKGLKITNYSTARMITLLQLCAQATHNQKTLLEKQISPPHNPPSFLPPRHTCMQLFPFVGRARTRARTPARPRFTIWHGPGGLVACFTISRPVEGERRKKKAK